jgi:hypothetical protein
MAPSIGKTYRCPSAQWAAGYCKTFVRLAYVLRSIITVHRDRRGKGGRTVGCALTRSGRCSALSSRRRGRHGTSANCQIWVWIATTPTARPRPVCLCISVSVPICCRLRCLPLKVASLCSLVRIFFHVEEVSPHYVTRTFTVGGVGVGDSFRCQIRTLPANQWRNFIISRHALGRRLGRLVFNSKIIVASAYPCPAVALASWQNERKLILRWEGQTQPGISTLLPPPFPSPSWRGIMM